MLLVSDEQIKNLIGRLPDPKQHQKCLEEIQRMLDIKQTLLWRADASQACCGWPVVARFTTEVKFLEDILDAFQDGQIEKSSALLEDYRVFLTAQI